MNSNINKYESKVMGMYICLELADLSTQKYPFYKNNEIFQNHNSFNHGNTGFNSKFSKLPVCSVWTKTSV